MGHGKEEHTALHIAVATRIEERPGSQSGFATRNFPCGLLDACRIHQMNVGLPAHTKPNIEAAKGSQPRTATKAAIKQMQQSAPPPLGDQTQELAVFIFLITGQRPA